MSHEVSFVGRGEAGAFSMNAQLIYADKRGSLCTVNQGSNERDHKDGPQVTIRDLALGAELAAATKDRADYLALRANAQFTVPEDQLVESVRKALPVRLPCGLSAFSHLPCIMIALVTEPLVSLATPRLLQVLPSAPRPSRNDSPQCTAATSRASSCQGSAPSLQAGDATIPNTGSTVAFNPRFCRRLAHWPDTRVSQTG